MEGGKINPAIGSYGGQPTTATPGGVCCTDELRALTAGAREAEVGGVMGPSPISLVISMPTRPPVLVQGPAAYGRAPPAQRCGSYSAANGDPAGARPHEASAKLPLNTSKDSRVARPPPKKKWIKEYFVEYCNKLFIRTMELLHVCEVMRRRARPSRSAAARRGRTRRTRRACTSRPRAYLTRPLRTCCS
ncbi:hypothetical protein EVAR_102742_1 [Eumeta japonica]|uniref:Uncharacterized protein n=1 Tax=Eumeta variegata TaxID=151549 RepID=A0A4C1THT0_EUMVA|nr:hypothetical protein EVAR_102742_1 [Eumeta japonica]